MPGKQHYSKEEERERAHEIREKEEHGATLTREEAGFLGAVASRQSTSREREEAQREGRGEEFRAEHATRSWTKGDDTRKPHLSEATKREVERIEEKEKRGETLTRHEAGVLGGAKRAREESE
jgi:hypothetical protein